MWVFPDYEYFLTFFLHDAGNEIRPEDGEVCLCVVLHDFLW